MSIPRVIVLDRYPDHDDGAWDRLIRDVIGGGNAASALIAALDRPVEALLVGVDVEAALDAADGPAGRDAAEPEPAHDGSADAPGHAPIAPFVPVRIVANV